MVRLATTLSALAGLGLLASTEARSTSHPFGHKSFMKRSADHASGNNAAALAKRAGIKERDISAAIELLTRAEYDFASHAITKRASVSSFDGNFYLNNHDYSCHCVKGGSLSGQSGGSGSGSKSGSKSGSGSASGSGSGSSGRQHKQSGGAANGDDGGKGSSGMGSGAGSHDNGSGSGSGGDGNGSGGNGSGTGADGSGDGNGSGDNGNDDGSDDGGRGSGTGGSGAGGSGVSPIPADICPDGFSYARNNVTITIEDAGTELVVLTYDDVDGDANAPQAEVVTGSDYTCTAGKCCFAVQDAQGVETTASGSQTITVPNPTNTGAATITIVSPAPTATPTAPGLGVGATASLSTDANGVVVTVGLGGNTDGLISASLGDDGVAATIGDPVGGSSGLISASLGTAGDAATVGNPLGGTAGLISATLGDEGNAATIGNPVGGSSGLVSATIANPLQTTSTGGGLLEATVSNPLASTSTALVSVSVDQLTASTPISAAVGPITVGLRRRMRI